MVHLDANTENYDDLHNAISSVMRNGCGIKANIETKDNLPNIKSRNVEMRNQLDLYANILHCYSRPGVITRHDNIDVVLVRQNTEGMYNGLVVYLKFQHLFVYFNIFIKINE